MTELALREAILIDLASIQSFSARAGLRIDYGRLRDRLSREHRLVRAAAYGTVDANQPNADPQYTWMARNGYKVVTKPLRRREDGTMRASVQVEMTVDALELASHIDLLMLVASDPDLTPLIEAVQRRGVRVVLVGSEGLMASSLLDAADEVLPLEGLLDDIRQREVILPSRGGRPRSGARRVPAGRRNGEPRRREPAPAQPEPSAAARSDAPKPATEPAPEPSQPAASQPATEPAPEPSQPAAAKPATEPEPSGPAAVLKQLPQERIRGRSASGPAADET